MGFFSLKQKETTWERNKSTKKLSIPFMGFFSLKQEALAEAIETLRSIFQFPLWDFSRWNQVWDKSERRKTLSLSIPFMGFFSLKLMLKGRLVPDAPENLSIPFMGFFSLKQLRGFTYQLFGSFVTFNSLYGIFLVETDMDFLSFSNFQSSPLSSPEASSIISFLQRHL